MIVIEHVDDDDVENWMVYKMTTHESGKHKDGHNDIHEAGID